MATHVQVAADEQRGTDDPDVRIATSPTMKAFHKGASWQFNRIAGGSFSECMARYSANRTFMCSYRLQEAHVRLNRGG